MTATVKIGSLASSAVLVSLNISQWTARRFDRDASTDVTTRNNATMSAARVNKLLISREHMDKISKAATEARTAHDRLTLPWGQRGTSILPCAAFPEYRKAMSPLKSAFQDAARQFCAAYPELRDQARADLGSLFKADDYPSPDDIERRFAFSLAFLPVPTENDFRVNIHEDALQDMREEIAESTRLASVEAVKDVYRRVSDVTSRMAEKLREYKPAEEGARAQNVFRDSLVTNVRELADTLPLLNVFGDSEIDALAKSLRDLASADASDLRESDALRGAASREAERIASLANAYL